MDDDEKVVSFQSKINAEDCYKKGTDHQFEHKEYTLGPWSSYSYRYDAKHLLFALSRYKFAAKLLEGKKSVLDVGCGDGVGLPLLAQAVPQVIAVDWDKRLIEGNQKRLEDWTNISHICCDLNRQDLTAANLDAAISIDVLEHLEPGNQDEFLRRICKCLHHDSIMIHGTPNMYANVWASPQSKIQHINLFDLERLRETMQEYCVNVFTFTQNDEMVGTSYDKMAHYIWAVGVSIKGKYLG